MIPIVVCPRCGRVYPGDIAEDSCNECGAKFFNKNKRRKQMSWKFWAKKPEAPQQQVEEAVVTQPPTPPKPQFGLDKAMAVFQETQSRFGDDETAKQVIAFIVPMVVGIMDGEVTLANEAEIEIMRLQTAEQTSVNESEDHAAMARKAVEELRQKIAAIEDRARQEAAWHEQSIDRIHIKRKEVETVARYFAQ